MSEESMIASILSTIGTNFDELVPSMARMHIVEDIVFLVALLVGGVLIVTACYILRRTFLKQKSAGKLDCDSRTTWDFILVACACVLFGYGIFFVAQGTAWIVDIVGWCSHPKARAIEALLQALGKS